jgi:agarase
VLSQTQRGDAYWYYLTGALANPLIVGTHWFQYLDQPLAGRPDGENWAIGFVDVTDTPYQELTKVSRELGSSLYARRLGLNPPPDRKSSMASAAVSSPSGLPALRRQP